MSTHEVKVVRITEIQDHPDADRLSLVQIWGYTCAIRKGQFNIGDLVAFVEPDYNVPLDRPEFSFLQKPGHTKTRHRIAVQRLRGIYSQGLLVAAPEGSKEGDNVITELGIERWEPDPEILVRNAFAESGPDIVAPRYDLENYKKFKSLLVEGENCIITVKLNGTNSRFLWHKDRMFCGSHNQWKKKSGEVLLDGKIVPNNAWWSALEQNPWIEEYCRAHPDTIVYGECFGPNIQKHFHYGVAPGRVAFRVFDILTPDRHWVNNFEFLGDIHSPLEFVPVLHVGPYHPEFLEKLAEAPETFNGVSLGKNPHVREGVVIKVKDERYDPSIGRVALKYVSNQYYEQK